MGHKYFLKFLILVAALVGIILISYPDKKLHIIACDVGQGDALLVTMGSDQILIDGGPNNKVLDCLASHMPFWDRKIELVVLTHSEKDHYQGLIEVFRRYQVETMFRTPLDAGSNDWQVLESAVGGNGTKIVNPTTGMNASLGLMHLEILNPLETNVLGNPNDFSIVLNLTYKDFDALFTGDIGPEVIDEVLATGRVKEVELLKVPHHGSKNGLTADLLAAASPEVATIGVGKNQWGHPHQEVLDILANYGLQVLRTDQLGDVEIITDGQTWRVNR
jgi:competence protein ComEC